MDPIWRDHLRALQRFNAWETAELRSRPSDYSRALAWLSDAWEFAERYGSTDDEAVRRRQHLENILQSRRALERAGIRP